MPSESKSQPCMSGCGKQVSLTMLACKLCWARLPEQFRFDIQHTSSRKWRDGQTPHRKAIGRAYHWFREHPPSRFPDEEVPEPEKCVADPDVELGLHHLGVPGLDILDLPF